jgi:hypothetical protein
VRQPADVVQDGGQQIARVGGLRDRQRAGVGGFGDLEAAAEFRRDADQVQGARQLDGVRALCGGSCRRCATVNAWA